MAKSERQKSTSKPPKSRGAQIREFVFGSGGLAVGRPDAQPEKPDTEELYSLAQNLAGVYEAISHPGELIDHPLFRQCLRTLDHPGFTSRDLLMFGQGDNEVLGQVALYALSRREPDPGLRKDLLAFMERVSYWRRYFILEALLTHVPDTDPLIGEVCLLNRAINPQYLQMFFAFSAEFLAHRLSGGELPTFAGKLENMGPQDIAQLEQFLDAAEDERLAPLARELDLWRATFVDKDLLRSAGRIWGEAGHSSDGPVNEHPTLIAQTESIIAGLEQVPRRSTLIVGERGCGKTALMRAVGRRLARQGWLVFEANGPDLVAGQKYMGEFEQRLKEVVAQLSGQRRALWYVPDFNSLQLAGTHRWSRAGALDMLLPLVESGQIVLVGEARPEAFEKIQQDQPRCLSAFDLCRVAPLGEKETMDLAHQWIEAHSAPTGQPLVGAEVLKEAWLLACQYLPERVAPGNLLEFLQLARTGLGPTEGPDSLIRVDDLIAALSRLTGLPAAILDDRQQLDTADLHRFFQERIMGQPEAVDCVIDRINIIKSGWADPSRPQGVFLFAGPSGTGKTEIAKALATYLFGSENRLFRLDMSEFQNPQELERLIGRNESQDNQGLDSQSLAARVRKQPFSVVLLDEFEKAHPRVWDLFLQVFDDGRLTDSQGRTIDFRHTIILLTSNLGAHAPSGASVGFSKDHEGFRPADVDKAISRVFRREFLNRLDRVVVFRPLSRESMRRILVKELKDIQLRRGLRNRSWEVVWEESATDFLLDRGFSPDLGARPLKRAVERHLLTPLAETIVQRRFPEGDQFLYIHCSGDHLQVEFIDPHEPEAEQTLDESFAADDQVGISTVQNLSLPGIALNPGGTSEEVKFLETCFEERRAHLDSAQWCQAKDLALSMMSMSEFWSSAERFPILGEVEYRERVASGLNTAGVLLNKLQSSATGGREHFSRRMIGQVAERLLLLDQACLTLEAHQPWEAFLSLEIKTDSAMAGLQDAQWLTKLRDMYLGWAGGRKMQVRVLQDTAGQAQGRRAVILAVSGFAAFQILQGEEGLHLWEAPSTKESKPHDHHQVLVRVVAQPEDLSGEPGADLLPAARALLGTPLPGAPAIVRIYRDSPAPLVKDRVRGWRTGRLDRVLGGAFDLMNLNADQGPQARSHRA